MNPSRYFPLNRKNRKARPGSKRDLEVVNSEESQSNSPATGAFDTLTSNEPTAPIKAKERSAGNNPNDDRHILNIRELSVGYDAKKVLDNLCLEIHKGEFISLLGPNGAGKTTLLRTLAGLLPALGGTVEIEQKDLLAFRPMERAKILAVVLTGKLSPGLLTAYEFAAMGRYPHTDRRGRLGKEDHAVVTEVMNLVGAADLSKRLLSTLSDGERQKVLLARALAQEPRFILLDEPTIHLDLRHRLEVMTIIGSLCREKGITAIASLHDVDIAAKLSDRVAMVKDGGITAWGTPETVLGKERVDDLYDLSGMSFSPHLGSIEIRGRENRGTAFVAAGMGSGSMVFRLLARNGFALRTGVLHENDIDRHVASALSATGETVPAMAEITEADVDRAIPLVRTSDFLIDAGFTVSRPNRANLRLISHALEWGVPVFSLRKSNDLHPGSANLIGRRSPAPIPCRDLSDLLRQIQAYTNVRPEGTGGCSTMEPSSSPPFRAQIL